MEWCDGNEWSDDEWIQGATQQYVEDGNHSEGCIGKERDAEELLQREGEGLQRDGGGMEEFVEFEVDSSFDEWTATFLGRESLGCGRNEVTKEVMMMSNGTEEPSPGSEVVLTTAESSCSDGDSRAGVGYQGEAQASNHPDEVSDETSRPTATHPEDAADDRSKSERKEGINRRDPESEPEEDALLITNGCDMKGMVRETQRTCQDATRPDSVGRDGIESVTAVFPIEHSSGENVTARKRGKPERDALLDSNQDMTGSQDDRNDELPQDDIDPGLDGVRRGQEPVEDVSGTAPPGGEMPVAPPVGLYNSPHSQPASQHDSLRMTSKNDNIHNSRNVTLGPSAHRTPEVGCFFKLFKIQFLLMLYYSACKKATAMLFILGDRAYPAVRIVNKMVSKRYLVTAL